MKKMIIATLLALTVSASLVGCATTNETEAKNTRAYTTTEAPKNLKSTKATTRSSMDEIKPWEINYQYYPHDELPEEILPKNTKVHI